MRRETVINFAFLSSPEYQELSSIQRGFASLGQPPYMLERGKEQSPIERMEQLVEHVETGGRSGLTIQRYKGLGEMNPDQLWETTMDPERRTLLQVRVDDSVEADKIFTVLMGDLVEPRREFIEVNALNVRNLDV